MNFKIIHETTYTFSDKVFLEPHYLRFRPKQTPFIDVIDFSIVLRSEPEGHTVFEDEDHNVIDFCWFEKLTDNITITAQTNLQTKTYNPFNFLVYPDSFNTIPFKYSDHQHQILYAALQGSPLTHELIDYADRILASTKHNTITFITNLTTKIHNDFCIEYRENGPPLTPESTFAIKTGSCRDLSWMQINILRHYGIAARFVSGYFYFETEEPVYQLHAWTEVLNYLAL